MQTVQNMKTARVLFPCGRVATVLVGKRCKRKNGSVRGFVHEQKVEPVVLADHKVHQVKQEAYIDRWEVADSNDFSQVIVCGGSSVKKTNREERSRWNASRRYWRIYWRQSEKDCSWKRFREAQYH
jgi:hypothetical protein